MSPSAVSLFTNCGAGDVGFARAGFGFEVLAEIDRHRLAVAALNLPGASLIPGDLRETWPDVVAAYRDRRDQEPLALLAACPPCQGLSTANARRGMGQDADSGSQDARNLLVVPDRRGRDCPRATDNRGGKRPSVPDPEGPAPSHAGSRVRSGASDLVAEGGVCCLPPCVGPGGLRRATNPGTVVHHVRAAGGSVSPASRQVWRSSFSDTHACAGPWWGACFPG